MEATCRGARWQVGKFLGYLEQRGIDLGAVKAEDIDAYFEHSSKRWGRASLRTAGQALRAWFAYANQRGWVAINLAPGIVLPRLYRQETLPIGPTWDEVSELIKDTTRGKSVDLRDRAILLLFSVYGLRSGEVRRLVIEDVDWRQDRIRVVRSKSGREQLLPLEAGTGNAIARYLREGRPRSDSRVLFLRDRAPHEPLSSSGMYAVVTRHADGSNGAPRRGRGPHGLRHACARHLLESGRSMKEVGDHLGHRSPDATQIYAKVDLTALRRVALQDMGGLA
jgi:site-specific recombinase XerD